MDIAPALVNEIERYNSRSRSLVTAKIVPLRPAIRSIDDDMFDSHDWHPDGDFENQPVDILHHVAISQVQVYYDGQPWFTLPTRLPVYFSDWEFMDDMCFEAIEVFGKALESGIISPPGIQK
jgi:hypothetical protein